MEEEVLSMNRWGYGHHITKLLVIILNSVFNAVLLLGAMNPSRLKPNINDFTITQNNTI